jgi:tRNA(fMet)-specific endonuclease VapC
VNGSIQKDGSLLLDTNCAIEVIAELPLAKSFVEASEVFLPIIAVGELLFGAYNSGRRQANLVRAREFSGSVRVLYCDDDTADWYGRIRHQLKEFGRPIPDNDIWIAAIAMQYDLVLASKDGHFDYVDGLERIEW